MNNTTAIKTVITTTQLNESSFEHIMSAYTSILTDLFTSFKNVIFVLGFWILLGLALLLVFVVLGLLAFLIASPFIYLYERREAQGKETARSEERGREQDLEANVQGSAEAPRLDITTREGIPVEDGWREPPVPAGEWDSATAPAEEVFGSTTSSVDGEETTADDRDDTVPVDKDEGDQARPANWSDAAIPEEESFDSKTSSVSEAEPTPDTTEYAQSNTKDSSRDDDDYADDEETKDAASDEASTYWDADEDDPLRDDGKNNDNPKNYWW